MYQLHAGYQLIAYRMLMTVCRYILPRAVFPRIYNIPALQYWFISFHAFIAQKISTRNALSIPGMKSFFLTEQINVEITLNNQMTLYDKM